MNHFAIIKNTGVSILVGTSLASIVLLSPVPFLIGLGTVGCAGFIYMTILYVQLFGEVERFEDNQIKDIDAFIKQLNGFAPNSQQFIEYDPKLKSMYEMINSYKTQLINSLNDAKRKRKSRN